MNGLDRIKFSFQRYFFRLQPVLKFFANIPRWISATATRHSIKLACFLWLLAVLAILGWIYGIHSSPWWPYFELSREPVTFIRPENRAEDLRNLLWAISFIGGALAAVIALINALRRTRMVQREQDAEIFAKAVEQLGSPERAVRLGAIYALEGLMRIDFSEPGRDGHIGRQIGETLAAYVREKSPLVANKDKKPNDNPISKIDIEAVIIVLSRSWPYKRRPDTFGGNGVNLINTNLSNIKIPDCSDLRRFNFDGSDLSKLECLSADFRESKAKYTNFNESYLSFADFSKAHVEHSSFHESYLMEANFKNSVIFNCEFNNSEIGGSNFSGANMQNTKFLKSSVYSIDFTNSIMHGAVFDGSDISGSKFNFFLKLSDGLFETGFHMDAIKKAKWSDGRSPQIT